MKISTLGTRISGFARTALTAATRRNPKPETRNQKLSPPPLASIIRPQARERWLLPQVGAITPQYIEMTLRGALAGAHLPQWELLNLMEDTWPRLRKNVIELKMAVRTRRAVFEAYRDEDEPESSAATERMKLVSAALRQMQPDAAADEGGFDEMIGDILDAWFKGVSVLEIDWRLAQTRQLGRFVAPRAVRWASPMNYAWDENLRLWPGRFPNPRVPLSPFPQDRFIVAKCKTKSGSILGGALLRPLVWWWCAANFSADWLLNLAQVFGLPFRWATYEPAAPQETVDRICAMLQNMGSAGWAAFPAGTTLELKAEGQKSGAQTPQGDMLDRADKQCDLLVLGQTLTSDTGGMGSGGGSHALGQVHAGVRGGIIDAAAKFAAGVIEQQLIPAILRLNYGDADEAPTLTFHERGEEDLGARAHWLTSLAAAGAARIIPLDWLGKTFGIPKPEPGEQTLEDAKREAEQREAMAAMGPMDQETLAARTTDDDSAQNDSLQAGFWREILHPRARGRFAEKFVPKAMGGIGVRPTLPAGGIAHPSAAAPGRESARISVHEPEPVPHANRSYSSPENPSSDPVPGEQSESSHSTAAPKEILTGKQLIEKLRPELDRWSEIRLLDAQSLAIEDRIAALDKHAPNYYKHHQDLFWEHVLKMDEIEKFKEKFAERGRRIIALPTAHRGILPIVGSIPKEIREIGRNGRRIVQRYVHASLLPETGFVALPWGKRSYHEDGIAYLSLNATGSLSAHEIVHGIEKSRPDVLEKNRAFLTKRAGGKKPVRLKDIYPNRKYEDHEFTWEDSFDEFGGTAYSGKDTRNTGDPKTVPSTELLTTGIERLHRNPMLFATTDPEYFTFVIETLRNL